MIVDVLHFSFTVSDIERAIKWWTDVLGLELVHRQRQDNAYTQQLVGIEGAILEVAQLKLPSTTPRFSSHVIELVEYANGAGARRQLPTNDVGVAHFALLVTDIHARYRRMVDQGVVFRNPPVEITAGANRGGWACYFSDPDGITLELLQFSRQRSLEAGIPTDEDD